MEQPALRPVHEIEYGKKLAQLNTELIWGWGTPAGKVRAQRRASLIMEGLNLNSKMRVLEIGCGTGLFTELFSQSGAEILAVDISPDLLEIARQRNLDAKKVTFLQKRFEDCNVEGPFDAVIGSSILHHLNIQESLAKIIKLLKPGSMMSFAEPNMRNPQIFIERKFSFYRPLFWYLSPDETAFTKQQMTRLLTHAGFEHIVITLFDWLHPATPVRFIPLVSKLGVLLERTPGICEFSGSLIIKGQRPR